MISIEEIEHLATLARIGMTDAEKKELQKDLERILEYVGEIQKAPVSETTEALPLHRNVLRDDAEPHAKGEYTEAILEAAPDRAGKYFKVKKILEQGR